MFGRSVFPDLLIYTNVAKSSLAQSRCALKTLFRPVVMLCRSWGLWRTWVHLDFPLSISKT